MKKTYLILSIIFIGTFLTGCNFPADQATETVQPEIIFTAAAETVIAEYTAVVETGQTEGEPATAESPEPPPIEVTNTLQPTETPTPSPTATSTETPTPTKDLDPIFEDDFSSGTGWFTTNEDDFVYEFKDNGYRIFNNVLNAGYWSVRYQEFDDIRIDVDVTRLAGPVDGYFGVVCRFEDDGADYYALVINDSGFYGILKYEDGDGEFLESGVDKDEKINRGTGETNRISGVCADDRLALSVNGHQLIEVFDDAFTTGDIGIIAGNQLSGVGIDVLFDNFAIFRP